jgi:predicted phosphodiesterase
MRIVCLSDTHGLHDAVQVPPCDLLLHAGDISRRGRHDEVAAFLAWFAEQPARHRVFCAGNHDFLFQKRPEEARALVARHPVIYLQDEAIHVEGLHIWGSPWQPWFHNWAFNVRTTAELADIWAQMPERVDILLTHTPAMGVLDRTVHGEDVGCPALRDRLLAHPVPVHVFGHIHEACGAIRWAGGLALNASCLDVHYEPVYPPTVLDWPSAELPG